MPADTVDRFKAALRGVEDYGDATTVAGLFTEDAELSSPGLPVMRGRGGVIEFWMRYLSSFQEIHTDFVRTFKQGDSAVLEWVSTGRLISGRTFSYDGATVLELREGKISRLRGFYDVAALQERTHPADTARVMEGGGRRETSTPGEGVLTSSPGDMDAATD